MKKLNLLLASLFILSTTHALAGPVSLNQPGLPAQIALDQAKATQQQQEAQMSAQEKLTAAQRQRTIQEKTSIILR